MFWLLFSSARGSRRLCVLSGALWSNSEEKRYVFVDFYVFFCCIFSCFLVLLVAFLWFYFEYFADKTVLYEFCLCMLKCFVLRVLSWTLRSNNEKKRDFILVWLDCLLLDFIVIFASYLYPFIYPFKLFLFLDDERHVEEGLMKKTNKNRDKHHLYEDRFTDFKQTVIVWCSKDYNQTRQ